MLGLRCHTGFSLVGEPGLLSSCGGWASHCGGFFCEAQAVGLLGFSSCSMWAQPLQLLGSTAQAQSCGAWASLL